MYQAMLVNDAFQPLFDAASASYWKGIFLFSKPSLSRHSSVILSDDFHYDSDTCCVNIYILHIPLKSWISTIPSLCDAYIRYTQNDGVGVVSKTYTVIIPKYTCAPFTAEDGAHIYMTTYSGIATHVWRVVFIRISELQPRSQRCFPMSSHAAFQIFWPPFTSDAPTMFKQLCYLIKKNNH